MRPRNKVGIAAATSATSTGVSCYLWYRPDMPVLKAISISSYRRLRPEAKLFGLRCLMIIGTEGGLRHTDRNYEK